MGASRDGVPVDSAPTTTRGPPGTRLHFSKLIDRFVQNLRRVAGYDVQYFVAVEPAEPSAPHLHVAMRGSLLTGGASSR